MTVQRKHSSKIKPKGHHQPARVSNRFSLLSDAPTEKHTLEIGSPIVRNVALEIPSTVVKCFPGSRAADIKSHLKLLADYNREYSKHVMHAWLARLPSEFRTSLNCLFVLFGADLEAMIQIQH